MIDTGTTVNPPTDSESRLKRAAELAEYLRGNPKEARREPEDLAEQFGLDPAMVAQIRSNYQARSTAPTAKGQSFAKRFVAQVKALWPRLLKVAERSVSRPYLFQVLAAILTLSVGFDHTHGSERAIVLWCVLQAWCLLMKPRFRYVVSGSALVWAVAAVLLFHMKRGEAKEMPLPWGVIAALFGLAMATLNLMMGGILALLSGWLQIALQRRRSAALSRQDLLMRMFDLQQQLASLPVIAPKTLHPWFAFARRRPFLTAAVLAFSLTSLEHLLELLFHLDPAAIERIQQAHQSKGVKLGKVDVVTVSSLGVSGVFLAIMFVLGFVSVAVRVVLGFAANSWRKVGNMLAGLSAGFAMAAGWAIPAGAFGSTPMLEALGTPFQELFSWMAVILLVRFGVSFHRALTSYRVGVKPDEASIVGELLEIRHRLSANPALVCVLVVDAAGSTEMKKVQDTLRVEYSFGRYHDWLGRIVAQHGGKVEIRTGDGAICAFGSAAPAMAAAWQIQKDVAQFNKAENKLDLPFRLRVALHAGYVQADLEKVQFTEVIDVAAHSEKHSPIGGIALTASFIQALPNSPELPVCATVDGVEVHAMSM